MTTRPEPTLPNPNVGIKSGRAVAESLLWRLAGSDGCLMFLAGTNLTLWVYGHDWVSGVLGLAMVGTMIAKHARGWDI